MPKKTIPIRRRARPNAKPIHKTRFLSIRLTPTEYAELETAAKVTHSPTVSAHCRLQLVGLFARKAPSGTGMYRGAGDRKRVTRSKSR